MPFCRHGAVLRIEKRVFGDLREYTKVSRIIQVIFFYWLGVFDLKYWSGKRDSNPRPSPWQGDALPLSYSRESV